MRSLNQWIFCIVWHICSIIKMFWFIFCCLTRLHRWEFSLHDVAKKSTLELKSHFTSRSVFKNCDEWSWDRDMKCLQSGYCTYSEQPGTGCILIKSSLVHWAGQGAHQRLKVSKSPDAVTFTALWLTDSTWLGCLTYGESSVTPWWSICAQALKLSLLSNLRWTQHFWVTTLLRELQRAGGRALASFLTQNSAALFNHTLNPRSNNTHKAWYDWVGPSQGLLLQLHGHMVSFLFKCT